MLFKRFSLLIMQIALVLTMAGFFSPSVYAAFVCPGITVQHKTINLNDVTVSAHNDPNGFYKYSVPLHLLADISKCTDIGGSLMGIQAQGGSINRTGLERFRTNLPGIMISYLLHDNSGWAIHNSPSRNNHMIPFNYTGELQYRSNGSDAKIIYDGTVIKLFTESANFISGDIDATSFPHIQLVVMNEGLNSPAVTILADISFTGKIHIVNTTCTTPDYTYSLGLHHSDEFTGLNSTSAWVNTPVTLSGCSVFHGNLHNGSIGSTVTEGNPGVYTSSANATNIPNEVSMTLTPGSMWIDKKNGIIALNGNSNSASGIGIQIGLKNSSGNYIVQDQNSPMIINPSLGLSGDITFPLGARYIQTGQSVTGGDANAQVTYTIDYN
ncbi:TPA: fimbrial protein [Enterobacter hormaechei]